MRTSSTYRAQKPMCLETMRNFTWDCSKCCKNISAVMPEMGDPTVNPLDGLVNMFLECKVVLL